MVGWVGVISKLNCPPKLNVFIYIMAVLTLSSLQVSIQVAGVGVLLIWFNRSVHIFFVSLANTQMTMIKAQVIPRLDPPVGLV